MWLSWLPKRRGPVRDEHVDVESKEFLGQRWQPIIIPLRPTELDEEIATFDPAEIAKSGAKRRNATCLTGRGYKTQEADTSNLKRLRARRERPRSSRAAEQRDEIAPFQLIELHSVPTSHSRAVGYRIGDRSVGGYAGYSQLAGCSATRLRNDVLNDNSHKLSSVIAMRALSS